MRVKTSSHLGERDRNRVKLPACGEVSASQIGRCRVRDEFKGAQRALLRRLWLLGIMARGGLVCGRAGAALKLTCSKTVTARIQCERQEKNCELGGPSPHDTILQPFGPGLPMRTTIASSYGLLEGSESLRKAVTMLAENLVQPDLIGLDVDLKKDGLRVRCRSTRKTGCRSSCEVQYADLEGMVNVESAPTLPGANRSARRASYIFCGACGRLPWAELQRGLGQ